MGSIVPFEPRQTGVRQTPQAAEGPASIIIFPGVRYERTDTPSPAAAVKAVGRTTVPRRKDRLPRH